MILKKSDCELKIDLVNDISYRVTQPWRHASYGLIDSWENMISNKIAAVYRFAAKDIADIHEIALQRSFDWKSVLEQAKQKDLGVEAGFVSEIIRSFPMQKMNEVMWIKQYPHQEFQADLNRIADDILMGA